MGFAGLYRHAGRGRLLTRQAVEPAFHASPALFSGKITDSAFAPCAGTPIVALAGRS
jgi:hypothetical protein